MTGGAELLSQCLMSTAGYIGEREIRRFIVTWVVEEELPSWCPMAREPDRGGLGSFREVP